MRYIAIGDLHGHFAELQSLYWSLINDHDVNPATDTFVFLGDYVDGGPDTRKVVSWLMAMQRRYPHWVLLRGNHEDMLLRAIRRHDDPSAFGTWYYQGGRATHYSYLVPSDLATSAGSFMVAAPQRVIPREHLHWLAGLPFYHETEDFIFVHAGLRPPLPPAANSETDLLWIRDEFIRSPYDWGERVIYGHTASTEPVVQRNKVGIDTMFFDEGKLTAVILDSERPEDATFVHQAAMGGLWRDAA
jgi:serine/threonine protein phosphatase 1